MSELLANEIIKIATFVPGLIGLANVDMTIEPTALPENEWAKGIYLEESSAGLKVTVAVLVDAEVKSSAIVSALITSIKSVFKMNKTKLSKVSVNIRGVK